MREITHGWLTALCLILYLNPAASQTRATHTVHVFVALADNEHQGIVPVPARLGNGLDPEHNLYWGAAAGVKTFFARSADWVLIRCEPKPKPEVLERCVFKRRKLEVYLVADAYRGDEIRQALLDFFDAAAGASPETVALPSTGQSVTLAARGGSNLVAYVGHDGLMDFRLPFLPKKKNESHRDAIILACASKQFFSEALRTAGAYPLLWTTNLMAPEAYTLKSALDGWIAGETRSGNALPRPMISTRSAVFEEHAGCSPPGGRNLTIVPHPARYFSAPIRHSILIPWPPPSTPGPSPLFLTICEWSADRPS